MDMIVTSEQRLGEDPQLTDVLHALDVDTAALLSRMREEGVQEGSIDIRS